MADELRKERPYDRLINGVRRRSSRVLARTLEEEADADRGRVLFSAPFRRLQNKAQVFSLESNAAVRSRLTHSLEVSSIGRLVAQQAIKAFSPSELDDLGLTGKERALFTFVETACLLHDLGNPPFGHFGEIAISDWFHLNRASLEPIGIGGTIRQRWEKYYTDFQHFDGNPQGFRIATKLQPSQPDDLFGLNLTATTLAATLKYPWTSDLVGQKFPDRDEKRKKAGFFQTELEVASWIWRDLTICPGTRHPLVYLMEAADDIAYCVSDIEDGIEKGLITGREFADYMMERLRDWPPFAKDKADLDEDVQKILEALAILREPSTDINDVPIRSLAAMNDFRSAVIRFLARHAGIVFRNCQESILKGIASALLRDCEASPLLKALNDFAVSSLYSSMIVRNREITAHAVLFGLLDAYLSLMRCDESRLQQALQGQHRDAVDRPIARDSSLISRIPRKHLAVYREEVHKMESDLEDDAGAIDVMERIHRMRLVVDYVSGMTDEFALQSFQLISGMQVNPHGN